MKEIQLHRAVVVLCLLCLYPTAVAAQDDNLVNHGYEGVRESVALFGDLPGLPMSFVPQGITLRVLPSGVSASGVYVYGATGLAVYKPSSGWFAAHPIEVSGGYRRLDIDAVGADDHDRLIAKAKHQLLTGGGVAATAIGEYARTLDLQTKAKAGLAFGYSLISGGAADPSLGLGLSAVWSTKQDDDADGVSDFVFAPGIVYARNSETKLAIDYSLDNDVDGEDRFSIVLQQDVSPLTLSLPVRLVAGVGKHRVVFLTAVITF